jgi:hypothetical protein
MPRFIVTINESDEESGSETLRYSQTVDQIDIHAVINAVNSSTVSQRVRALRSDAGKPRKKEEEQVVA